MIGGNGPRLLEVAARHADVVGITGLGRTLPDGHRHTVDWAPQRVADSIARVRATAQAADREPLIEALVQRVEITDDAERTARSIADAIEGATTEDLLAAPYVWLGTIDEIRAEVTHHAAVTGIDRWVVRDATLPALRGILGVD
jgi:alkanesulfonate monooxygenase SsuD/methylene tetrahydromethanopterin reductase-like flavin-dependent oxidoreductase (luciferase family)